MPPRPTNKINAGSFTHIKLPPKDIIINRSELNGMRVYYVDDTPLYSVTTILGYGHSWVDEWRKEVGDAVADSISKIASNTGQAIHTLCEHYLYNEDLVINNPFLFHRFKKFMSVLNNINNILCLEKSLYSMKLKIAGTVDCIAEYNGVMSIIDFKTSKIAKEESDIEDYFLQTTAYAIMIYELYNIKITQIVILMSVDMEDPVVYIKNIKDYIPKLRARIDTFYNALEK